MIRAKRYLNLIVASHNNNDKNASGIRGKKEWIPPNFFDLEFAGLRNPTAFPSPMQGKVLP